MQVRAEATKIGREIAVGGKAFLQSAKERSSVGVSLANDQPVFMPYESNDIEIIADLFQRTDPLDSWVIDAAGCSYTVDSLGDIEFNGVTVDGFLVHVDNSANVAVTIHNVYLYQLKAVNLGEQTSDKLPIVTDESGDVHTWTRVYNDNIWFLDGITTPSKEYVTVSIEPASFFALLVSNDGCDEDTFYVTDAEALIPCIAYESVDDV